MLINNHFDFTMSISIAQKELNAIVLEQDTLDAYKKNELLVYYKNQVEAIVNVEQCLAVLTNYQDNYSYIFPGSFGAIFGLSSHTELIDSAFEEEIFSKIHPDDLLERHILELRYFKFLMSLPAAERNKYTTFCYLRICDAAGNYKYITHKTIYLTSFSNGVVWLALCIYAPSTEQKVRTSIDGKIVNNETGETLSMNQFTTYDKTILSVRELEVLKYIALGKSSKEIAAILFLSNNTINRHRQNIIKKMKVTNSTEAVKAALLMGIIDI